MNIIAYYYPNIIFFLIEETPHSKVVHYQFGNGVHDKVGGDTIVLSFHNAIVNNKQQ